MVAANSAPSTPSMLKKAVHQHPALSARGMMERLFTLWFDSFVYNQIWEDPRVDLQALELTLESRVVTIASGGCNVMNYLVAKPRSIAAVDLNCYHIYLTNLKLAAARHLPNHDAFFEFFGSGDSDRNIDNYEHHIRAHLDADTLAFWEGGSWLRKNVAGLRIEYFSNNFYDYAKLGYLLRFVHVLTKLARKDPARLLAAKTREEREAVFAEQIAPFFDNRLVRLIGKHPMIMFSLGIPPSQYHALSEEMSGDIIDLYRERVRRLTCDFPIEDNYFTWQALSRRYDRKERRAIPDYLKREHFPLVRAGVENVRTHISTVTEYLSSQPNRSVDRVVLLDSQDWMTPDDLRAMWRQIARTGAPGARIIFRTGASRSPLERALPAELLQRFRYERERSLELHKQDRAAIYGGFHLYVLKD
jgi:S-adenosylmethionine-diacylglycerol 3-amino-3-carboxypropyl transferase